MKNNTILLFSFLLLLGFASCEKAKVNEPNDKPTVTINKPLDGDMYISGDTIPLNVVFTDPDELHEYSLEIINATDSSDLMHLHGHVHGTSFELDTFLVANVTVHSTIKLTAIATNHNNVTATAKASLKMHP